MSTETVIEWTGNIQVHRPAHKLVCDWHSTPSVHRCPCGWEVQTYSSPGQATAAAVQAAYAQHLNPAAGLDDGAD